MPINRALPWLLLALPLLPAPTAAPYYVVFLRPEPARTPLPPDEGSRLQAAHMANMRKMADEGVLVAAGPFEDSTPTISGIFIMRSPSLQAARDLAGRDPTVLAHRNRVDAHPWQGPEGIGMEYKRLHALNPQTPEDMQVHPLCLLYRGGAWEQSARDGLLSAHQQYLDRLVTEGKLAAAGAGGEGDELLGMVVFPAIEPEQARALLEPDPALRAGVLRAEYHRWWVAGHVLTESGGAPR